MWESKLVALPPRQRLRPAGHAAASQDLQANPAIAQIFGHRHQMAQTTP